MSVFQYLVDKILPARSPVPCPYVPKRQKAKKKTADRIPDDVQTVRGRNFKKVEEDGTDLAFDLWDGSSRSPDFTEADAAIVEEYNLPEKRYRELKVLWATGDSTAVVARNFKGQRGYGQRTLDTYFSAMSKAALRKNNPSPPTPVGE